MLLTNLGTLLLKPTVAASLPRVLALSGFFHLSAVMGSGPVKGFNPEVQQIITRKHDSSMNKIAKEEAEKATFAAGCFWGVQLAFQRVPGVVSCMVGYTGGSVQQPTYQAVCSGTTEHTEAVTMLFNPDLVSYKELLVVLFDRMDPTTLNRQGNDRGTQYRSGVYYHSEEQKTIAQNFVKEIQPKYKDTIVVEVEKAGQFWPAEDYHQKYLEKGSQKAAKGCLDPIKCYG
jgi:peptide-methionine (S)-S-oxide reductase